MGLSTKSPPRQSKRAFLEWLSRGRGDGARKRNSKARDSKVHSARKAEKLFVLSMHDLVRGRGAKGPKFLGWRHFGIGRKAGHRVSADIVASGKDRILARMYGHKSTVSVARALRAVRRKYMRSRRYRDICLLRIPPLVGLAVWIRGRKTKDDLIVPIESCLRGAKRGALKRFADLLPMLQASAKVLAEQSFRLHARLGNRGPRFSAKP